MGRFSVVDNGNANEMSTYLSYEVTRITTGPSLYSFLHLNLEPVTRDDELLWYCSKVPWRFYNDYFSENIENAGFYFGPDAKWTAMRDTTLYKMYYALLLKILPRRWSRCAGILADRKLKRVLTELITPVELWFWTQDGERYGNMIDFWASWTPPNN